MLFKTPRTCGAGVRAVHARNGLVTVAILLMFSGCAAVRQAPQDPQDNDAVLKELDQYFHGAVVHQYYMESDKTRRVAMRNEIVTNRVRAYDIEFSRYKNQLSEFGNSVSLGGDLIGLALGGLTATVGNAATKAALGAASAGVLGATTAINKDLFFQKTLPALKSQMDANRKKMKVPILRGLMLSDEQYPLSAAESDLQNYADAGGLEDAITDITATAKVAERAADNEIVSIRTADDFIQLPDKEAIETSVTAMTDSQVLALAKLMEANLPSRPDDVRTAVQTLDPDARRLNGDVARARVAMMAWLDAEVMNAANKKQWADAIKSVSN